MFREDRTEESEFVTISYWESVEAMSRSALAEDLFTYHRDTKDLPKEVQETRK